MLDLHQIDVELKNRVHRPSADFHMLLDLVHDHGGVRVNRPFFGISRVVSALPPGMMTSFSPPGFPSLFSLRIPPASCAGELSASARLGNTAAVNPNPESMEVNRAANALRVKVKFI